MNFNKFLAVSILILISSCASQKKIKLTKNDFKLTFESTKAQSVCINKMKYFILLSSLSTDKRLHNKLKKHTAFELCTKNYQQSMKLFNQHSNKIGVILEDNREQIIKSKSIIAGLKESASTFSKQNTVTFKLKIVKLKKKLVNQAISDLIIKDNAGLIITWGQNKFINHIQKWQTHLQIPTLFISSKIKATPSSFKIFPSKHNYSKKLINVLKKKNIKKVILLTNKEDSNNKLIKLIKKGINKEKIEIVHNLTYDKKNLYSFDEICRKIFVINKSKRQFEYNKIYHQEKIKSNNAGFKLNQKLVFLPPQINFDAIIIPDDFQTVHHFTKLFNYYNAKNIQLIGTYQWRSPDILKPNEKLLEGAVFIDFLGKKEDLPFNNKKSTEVKISEAMDYKLMGYYSGKIGLEALMNSAKSKKKIIDKLKKVRINDRFIKNKKAFQAQQFNWPNFAIEINQSQFFVK